MNDGDKKQFKNDLAALAALFDKELSRVTYRGYWMALRHVDLSTFQLGVEKAISACTFMPRPKELLEFCGEMNTDARARLAWEVVFRSIASKGSHASVDFDDPLTNATIRNMHGDGGWRVLCKRTSDDLQLWAKKDFLETYAALSAGGVTEKQCAPLAGSAERCAIQGGYPAPRISRVLCGLPAPRQGLVRRIEGGATIDSGPRLLVGEIMKAVES